MITCFSCYWEATVCICTTSFDLFSLNKLQYFWKRMRVLHFVYLHKGNLCSSFWFLIYHLNNTCPTVIPLTYLKQLSLKLIPLIARFRRNYSDFLFVWTVYNSHFAALNSLLFCMNQGSVVKAELWPIIVYLLHRNWMESSLCTHTTSSHYIYLC